MSFVARDPYLRAFALFGAWGNLAWMGVQTLLVVFLARVLGLPSVLIGLLMACMGVGGVLGAPRLVRRFGSARGLLLSQACTAPFPPLIPLAGAGHDSPPIRRHRDLPLPSRP